MLAQLNYSDYMCAITSANRAQIWSMLPCGACSVKKSQINIHNVPENLFFLLVEKKNS